jgi:hypothetical protein
MNMNINICTPALIYLVISFIGILLRMGDYHRTYKEKGKNGNLNVNVSVTQTPIIISLVIISLITYVLNEVCIRYSVKYSWYALAFLFFFPLLIALLTIIFVGSLFGVFGVMSLKN